MAKDKFLLVNLQEDKAKKLAQVISNESSRKILDYLAEKDATESDLSEKLNIPMPTVHYNLTQMMRAGLVTVETFHYSKKGKEMNHYKLANKYIIIAPKSTYGIKEKLRSILPAGLVAIAGAFSIWLYQTLTANNIQQNMMLGARTFAEDSAAGAPEAMMMKSAEPIAALPQNEPNIIIWFLAGYCLCLLAVIVFEIIRSKRS